MTKEATPGALGSNDQLGPLVERAGWLADKLHNGGDYGKEAAALLVQQAGEIERLHEQRRAWQAEREALLARMARCGLDARREERERLLAEWKKPGGLMQGPFA